MPEPEANLNDSPAPSQPDSSAAELEEKRARIERDLEARRRAAARPRMLQVHLRYPGLYLLFILANFLDLSLTRIALDFFGMDEANVAAKGILIRFGFVGFAVYKLILTALVITLAEIISRSKPRWAFLLILLGSVAVGALVVWSAGQLIGLTMSHWNSVELPRVLASL